MESQAVTARLMTDPDEEMWIDLKPTGPQKQKASSPVLSAIWHEAACSLAPLDNIDRQNERIETIGAAVEKFTAHTIDEGVVVTTPVPVGKGI